MEPTTPTGKIKRSTETPDFEGRRTYWEYIVDDFLETACFLSPKKRQFILNQLQLEDAYVEEIQTAPAFVMNQKLICISDAYRLKEVWIYYPKKQILEKHPLKAA